MRKLLVTLFMVTIFVFTTFSYAGAEEIPPEEGLPEGASSTGELVELKGKTLLIQGINQKKSKMEAMIQVK